jgi:hypothetical protein
MGLFEFVVGEWICLWRYNTNLSSYSEQLKDISGIDHVDLYYGDDIAVKLGHQDLPGMYKNK